MLNQLRRTSCRALGAALLLSSVAFAQGTGTGKLKVNVLPKQAYTFIDGHAIGPGSRTIKLATGTHHLVVAKYGFKAVEQDVVIDSDHTTPLDIQLEASGGAVSGPHGRIQIEVGMMRAGDAAVLLNGKSAAYFVGHVDEFNNEIINRQELIVPPGTHQLTVTRYGKELWSGYVTVRANERVIVDVSNGKQKTKPWVRGSTEEAFPRSKEGVASATVGIAPVNGAVSAKPTKIDCSQPAQLAWTSSEAVEADMSGMSSVPTSGERTVSPRQTTVYQLTATGPGGMAKSEATLEVNSVAQASLSASPTEVRFRRIGDKELEQESTTLNWSTSNSDSAVLEPLGSVEPSGSKAVTLRPTRTADGPVDEEVKYTLTATNVCGGSDTKVVAVHLTGSIDPIPEVLLHSVFFPTDYPANQYPALGLLRSQQDALANLAAGFKRYLEYDPNAKLALSAFADDRGPEAYNQNLSQLRAQRVRDFLISQGIAAERIDLSANGKNKQLDKKTVSDLQQRNPSQPSNTRARNVGTTWLAYNRRVDIVLLPTNTESIRFYPNDAADSEILWQRPKPARSVVESDN